MRFLADECCPRTIVASLRAAGHDVRYAAETGASMGDRQLLETAFEERRIVLTEDFDFGELLIRERRPSHGAIVLFLPQLAPADRAKRLLAVLSGPPVEFEAAITIVEARRIRQRRVEK